MKIYTAFQKFILKLSLFLFVLIWVLVFFQLASRNITGKSYVQIEELIIMLIPCLGFSAATYTLFRNNHVQIEFFYNRLPVRFRKILFFLTQAALIVFMVLIEYHSIGLASRQMKLVTPALGWPMGYQYISFALFGGFMVIPLVMNIYMLLTGKIEEFLPRKNGETAISEEAL